jgi:hypothetical protein
MISPEKKYGFRVLHVIRKIKTWQAVSADNMHLILRVHARLL